MSYLLPPVRYDKFVVGDKIKFDKVFHMSVFGEGNEYIRPVEYDKEYVVSQIDDVPSKEDDLNSVGHTQWIHLEGIANRRWSGAYFYSLRDIS